MIFSAQYGGLWKTSNGGSTWSHIFSAIWAKDVAYAQGNTVIATIFGDNKVASESGIWVSPDGGTTWGQASIDYPLGRGGVYGISVAPDDRRKVYVATDYGIATSRDNGITWEHTRLEGNPRSIIALPGNKAMALATTGVFRSDGGPWRRIKEGNFGFSNGDTFKLIDALPTDRDKVFILQDYDNLYLYEVAADRFSAIRVPGRGRSRNPFIRVSLRPSPAQGFELWLGNGVHLLRRTCSDIDDARRTGVFNWASFGRDDGIHDDTGFMGLDSAHLPVLYGSDGGIFKPANSQATFWQRAAVTGSGLNSYQITALGGTEYTAGDLSLYFSTQDNGSIWSSGDAGITWPRAGSPEGSFVQVTPFAANPTSATVAWNSIRGADPRWTSMFGSGNLGTQWEVPANSPGSRFGFLTGFSIPIFVAPSAWVRYRFPPEGGSPELYRSRDNGNTWVKVAEINLEQRGVPIPSRELVFGAFRAPGSRPGGGERIGIIKFDPRIPVYGAANLINLPDDGSLGIRATEFDFRAVFGVDPTNPDYIIAPDIVNGLIK
ncbi:MAG: hypothetical protein H7Y17_16965, partial [Chlorobia bacterium]|nr:hypothetical protein [Fimbriimonadaceae bacterium]